MHDSVAFPKLYERLKNKYTSIKNIVLDAGYKIPIIAKMIIDDGKTPVMPYKRPMTKLGFFKKYDYTYDEKYDCYICPNFHILKYTTTNREGYREYKSNGLTCKTCPKINGCTHSSNTTKVVTRHIWEDYMEQAEEIRHCLPYRNLYKKRSETIERVFADAKEIHGLRYAKHRGLHKVKMELSLLFSCMNLKKLAIRLWKPVTLFPFKYLLFLFYQSFIPFFTDKCPFHIEKGICLQSDTSIINTGIF